ncbi:hypothetical protein Patl1_22804 [Pistacia atlantica]|uniref:Uncharacterized protein n=1 Tax=Pistacia atlantica TaxID=434234 RepID=A0ACC0ZX98_9ROSI|nr:hypothetical protein Patl1_22804 [Pistacia atlantica]
MLCSMGGRGPNVERNNASLEELLHLSCLTALEIDIKGEKILPKGFFSKELKRYHISVNHDDVSFRHPWNFGFHLAHENNQIKLNSSICLSELQGIKSVEFLCLDELQNVKNGLQELDNDEVKGCDELKFLISFSTTKSLPQLQRLTVEDCKNVKEIFAIEREGECQQWQRNDDNINITIET